MTEPHPRTTRPRHVYHGFGFPVTLCRVPMIRLRGVWTPDVNYELLQRAVLGALVQKPSRLTGREIRFIRLSSEMTLAAFARRFAVTHPAVLKWESAGGKATGMGWATEKDIRLFALAKLKERPDRFFRIYQALETLPSRRIAPVSIDVSSVA